MSESVMSGQPVPGKRRAERPRRRRRREERTPTRGRRAYRPENHEGITPEFLQQLREAETKPVALPVRNGPGPREVLAGIDAELRADQTYLQALGRLAYG
jgi:hypothetical protein